MFNNYHVKYKYIKNETRIIFHALAIKGSKQAFKIKQKYYSD